MPRKEKRPADQSNGRTQKRSTILTQEERDYIPLVVAFWIFFAFIFLSERGVI